MIIGIPAQTPSQLWMAQMRWCTLYTVQYSFCARHTSASAPSVKGLIFVPDILLLLLHQWKLDFCVQKIRWFLGECTGPLDEAVTSWPLTCLAKINCGSVCSCKSIGHLSLKFSFSCGSTGIVIQLNQLVSLYTWVPVSFGSACQLSAELLPIGQLVTVLVQLEQ